MKICTIIGPTAVGKTGLAVEFAAQIKGEIISADSRQIYRKFNIGTAKPTPEEQHQIRFHMIDIIEPTDSYSCGQFARDAVNAIEEITAMKKIPIVCGGTGLYIKALFEPLHQLPLTDKVRGARSRLIQILDKKGLPYLYERLREIDPDWAKKISATDKQRIIRGLEIYDAAGKTLTSYLRQKTKKTFFLPYYIGLSIERTRLYRRIDERFDLMIKNGLIKEVKNLIADGLTPDNSALSTIGYKEIYDYLNGYTDLDNAIAEAKRRTRNFAKRQLTWFKRIPDVNWFDMEEAGIERKIMPQMIDQIKK